MTYRVKFKSEGPTGMVYYSEESFTLPFYWETTTVGFDVYLPSAERWPAFCAEHGAASATTRRDEIVSTLATEVGRTEAKRARIEIDDTGISFSYEGNWLRAILRKIFGLD